MRQDGQATTATPLDLDEVLDFLATLPNEAIQEVCQLAALERRSEQLRSRLLERLRGK